MLSLIPPVVNDDRDLRLWWLGDCSSSNLNYETLPIATMFAMKYGLALERLIKEVVIAEPALGLIHVLEADIRDSLYRIGLLPT